MRGLSDWGGGGGGECLSHFSCTLLFYFITPSSSVFLCLSISPSVSCSVGMFYDGEQGRCVLCPAGMYQDEEGQVSCEPCPGPEGRVTPRTVGARNIPECGGKFKL